MTDDLKVTLTLLMNRLEELKYTDDMGLDIEMEAYNDAIDDAIGEIDRELSQRSLTPPHL